MTIAGTLGALPRCGPEGFPGEALGWPGPPVGRASVRS